MDSNQNPESLQDLGKSREKMVGDKFVTPGIPGGLVTSADRKTGTVGNDANVKLREAMTQPNGNGVQP